MARACWNNNDGAIYTHRDRMTDAKTSSDVPNDPALEDEGGLIRHVHREACPPVDRGNGELRIPSSAFQLNKKKSERYLSIDLDQLLERDGLESTHHVPQLICYAARLVAADPRSQGLGVTSEPAKDNPHHGGIWGLEALARSGRERVQKHLAKRAVIIATSLDRTAP